jgi:hypothetical protein
MAEGAPRATRHALPVLLAGLLGQAVGGLAWWPALLVAGLALTAAGTARVAVPLAATARGRVPRSFPPVSIAAGLCWLLVALGWDAWAVLRAGGPGPAADAFGRLVVPFAVGFVAQVLIGSLAFLLPMVLGGGPARVRERTRRLDRFWAQRVALANLALIGYLAPLPAWARAVALAGLVVALLQFLVPAGVALAVARRAVPDDPP